MIFARVFCSEANHIWSSQGLTTMKMLRVMLADDHPVVREGLRAAINRGPDMHIIAEASNGREAVDKFFTERPDVALLDLRMPIMSGVETVAAIYQRDPAARLVVLTTYEDEEDIYRSL